MDRQNYSFLGVSKGVPPWSSKSYRAIYKLSLQKMGVVIIITSQFPTRKAKEYLEQLKYLNIPN